MTVDENGPPPDRRRRMKFWIGVGVLVLLVATAVAVYIGNNKVDEALPTGVETVPAANTVS